MNTQIVDAAKQSAALTIDQGASLSMACTFMAAANTIGLVMQNAAATQQGTQQIAQASVATTCALIAANAGA